MRGKGALFLKIDYPKLIVCCFSYLVLLVDVLKKAVLKKNKKDQGKLFE